MPRLLLRQEACPNLRPWRADRINQTPSSVPGFPSQVLDSILINRSMVVDLRAPI